MDSLRIFTLEAFFFTRARKYHEIFVANWMTFHVKISSFRVTRLRWIVERRFQRWFESNFCAFNFATIVKVFEALRDVASFAGRSLLGDVHSCNSIDGTGIHFLFVSIESWSFQFYLPSVERGLLSNIDNDNESMQAFLRRRIFLQIVEIEIRESSCLDKGIPSLYLYFERSC